LLLQDFWLQLYQRLLLLGTRRDTATCENESRRREPQNVLLHFDIYLKGGTLILFNSAGAISILRRAA
jgi:hypothetical protein